MEITHGFSICDDEISITFIRASGPGGQNVNKVATVAHLRFHALNSASLTVEVRRRLVTLAGRRMNKDGELIIEAKRYRTQEQNREDAENRLRQLILRAMEEPKIRFATKPSRSDREKRVETKKKRGEIKKQRHAPMYE